MIECENENYQHLTNSPLEKGAGGIDTDNLCFSFGTGLVINEGDIFQSQLKTLIKHQ